MEQNNLINEQKTDNQTISQQPVYVEVQPNSNGVGTAGFVLALINAIVFWIPVADLLCFILWPLAGLLSFIGLFKKPHGLAIVGLILSILPIFFLMAGAGALLSII